MWVSDIINDDYKHWRPGNNVLIRTQTGTGKTTFILGKLLKYAADNDKNIVMLVNRTILQKQVEKDIYKDYYKYREFIQVYTYQSYVRQPHRISGDYYVLDEAHYFIADASFNETTVECFRELMCKREAVKILMTATDEYVLLMQLGGYKFDSPYIDTVQNNSYSITDLNNINDLVLNKELRSEFAINYNNQLLSLAGIRKEIRELNKSWQKYPKNRETLTQYIQSLIDTIQPYRYHFRKKFHEIQQQMEQVRSGYICYDNPNSYDYLKVKYCNKKEELLEKICASGDEKWLWFVRKKKNGEELARQLSEREIRFVMMTKDSQKQSKNKPERKAYDNIVAQKRFDEKVLFATSALDNGVTILDEKMKHIVIDVENETEFLQMLGRIRIDPDWEDPTVTLYLINHSVASIIKRFDYSTMEHIRFIAGFLYYKRHDPISWTKLQTKYNHQVIRNGQIVPAFAQLLVPDTFAVDEKHGSDFIFKKYAINYLCKLKCTYDYYKMMAWLEELLEAQQEKGWLLADGQEENAAEYERD